MIDRRNYTIDYFKFIASILIIASHTEPFQEINGDLCFFISNIICRLAVPFFAVCSGYFISKLVLKNDFSFTPIKKQEVKLVKLYILWTLLYFLFDIPFAILGGYFSVKNYIGFAISTFTSASHYHLWYLISLIYALPLFYICIKYLKRNILIVLMVCLYLIKVLSYGYTNWLPRQINVVLNICHKFDALFNAVFLLLPLLLLGFVIYTFKIPKIKWCVMGFCVSLILLTLEAFILRNFGQENVSYIFFTLPTAYFVFAIILQLKFAERMKFGRLFGSISLMIYCIHPMVIEVLPKDIHSLLKFLIVAVISISISVGYFSLKHIIVKNKKINN